MVSDYWSLGFGLRVPQPPSRSLDFEFPQCPKLVIGLSEVAVVEVLETQPPVLETPVFYGYYFRLNDNCYQGHFGHFE